MIVRCLLALFWHDSQRRLRSVWRLMGQLLFMFGLMFPAMLPVVIAMGLMDVGTDSVVFMFSAGLAQAAAIAASVVLAYWWLDRRRAPSKLLDLGFVGWKWSDFAIGFALGGLAMWLIFATQLRLGWVEFVGFGPPERQLWPAMLFAQAGWLVLMIAVGCTEELLSRGYQIKNLAEGMRYFGVWPSTALSAVLSALFFGLLHATNANATVVSTLAICLAGLMLAIARVSTGSLAAPIGLHISWNWFQGPLLGFPVSGNAVPDSFIALKQQGDPFWTGGSFGPEAGMLGILVVAALSFVFLVWGILSGNIKHTALALVRFRRVQAG